MSSPGGLPSVALAHIGIKPRSINACWACLGTEPLRPRRKRNYTQTPQIQGSLRLKQP